jgi:hypothetical protein
MGQTTAKKTPIRGPSLANLETILDKLFSSLAPPSASLYLEIYDDAISFIGAALDCTNFCMQSTPPCLCPTCSSSWMGCPAMPHELAHFAVRARRLR